MKVGVKLTLSSYLTRKVLSETSTVYIGIGIGIGLLKIHIAASKAELHEITV